MTTYSLARSHAYCDHIARTQAANFYPAFRLLPNSQRRAMCALYAFLRITDDLGDEPGLEEVKRASLQGWRQALKAAMEGDFSHRIHPALLDSARRFAIPMDYLFAAIDGVEMDLGEVSFATFADLQNYCFHVAGVVGLACIHIWGFAGEKAKPYAEAAGLAFQLTNILRDLKEDAGRGRVYLPQEDLRRFSYDPVKLMEGCQDEAFRELMRFQVNRARSYYRESRPLTSLLHPGGRSVFLVMSRTYQGLLDLIEKRDYDVFSHRVRLSWGYKMFLAASAFPIRWGWF